MKETYIIGFMSFVLSGLSFMLIHAHVLLNRFGAFLLMNKADGLMIERFKTLLLYVSTCLFILPAIALGLSLFLIKKKSLWTGILTSLFVVFVYFYFISNII